MRESIYGEVDFNFFWQARRDRLTSVPRPPPGNVGGMVLSASSPFVGLIVATLVLLGARVSLLRLKERTRGAGSERLQRAARLHGNNLEWGVPFAVVLVALELTGAEARWVTATGVAFLVARAVHGAGWALKKRRLHLLGAGLNYLVVFAAAVGLVLRAF